MNEIDLEIESRFIRISDLHSIVSQATGFIEPCGLNQTTVVGRILFRCRNEKLRVDFKRTIKLFDC
jgi:hypothetical protein